MFRRRQTQVAESQMKAENRQMKVALAEIANNTRNGLGIKVSCIMSEHIDAATRADIMNIATHYNNLVCEKNDRERKQQKGSSLALAAGDIDSVIALASWKGKMEMALQRLTACALMRDQHFTSNECFDEAYNPESGKFESEGLWCLAKAIGRLKVKVKELEKENEALRAKQPDDEVEGAQ